MPCAIHHVALAVKEFDAAVKFFEEVFGMTVKRTAGEAPARKLWFNEGLQLNECAAGEEKGTAVDHLSFAVEDVPAAVDAAVARGCSRLPEGAHWFALPNGVKFELMKL